MPWPGRSKKLGLEITDEQIAELEAHKDDINYPVAEERERQVRHDVMSHVYAYGKQCPKSGGIIHLGATSCYVGDNTDVIILREASRLTLRKCAQVVRNLAGFADRYRALPCLGYTHLQPAQLTTVGKRTTLWMYELMQDMENLAFQLSNLKLLGSKGTTGTQASFMELLEGDEEKIKQMEQLIARDMGFSGVVPVSGQTYSRKVDAYFLGALSGIAQSAMKFANDLRILQSFEEMEEPFEKDQIGSSAMPYKRNPMRSERICALARYVICDSLNPGFTVEPSGLSVRWTILPISELQWPRPFGCGCHLEHLHERVCRFGGQRAGGGTPGDGKAALYGHGEHYDGVCETGGQPAGAS